MQTKKKNNNKRILVIGGVAAGSSAASKAKRINPDADVKIIQDENVVSYGACGMPYVIEGIINDFEELIERPPDIFKNEYDIDVIVNTRVHKIDRSKKEVYATDLQTGRETIFEYDSLVIATGARALVPNIKGVNQEGVFLIRNYGDGVKINDSTKNARSCLIAGAGLIGLEMAEAFKKRRSTTRAEMDVTVVEMSDHILPTILDSNMAKIVQRELEANGVKVILGERVEEIVGSRDGQVKCVKTTNTNTKREIDADFIVLGTGVRPNSEIARDAGIEIGYANAIKVDDHMRTNIPGIFAAGDCATARSYITNKDTYLPLGTTANKQQEIESITRAGYYPGSKPIWIKIVADRRSGRVLGSQIVGGEAVKERIDLIALALLLKADIRDLANYDACYVPPASPVWEPVNIAASQLVKKLL